jgi:hypothetical protein
MMDQQKRIRLLCLKINGREKDRYLSFCQTVNGIFCDFFGCSKNGIKGKEKEERKKKEKDRHYFGLRPT